MTAPVPFLSDAWVDAVDQALRGLSPTSGERWSVAYEVTGGPNGPVTHHLVFDRGTVRAMRAARPEGPSVTFSMSWDLAVAINRGHTSAQGAFLDGRIQVSGDPNVLLGNQADLATLDTALAAVRANTSYS